MASGRVPITSKGEILFTVSLMGSFAGGQTSVTVSCAIAVV